MLASSGRKWIGCAVVLVGAVLLLRDRGLADPGEQTPAAGMMIHRDPATGELVPAPPEMATQPAPRAVTRPTPMVERLGLSPGGGVLLDGIPRMGATVQVEPTGRVTAHCDRQPVAGAQ